MARRIVSITCILGDLGMDPASVAFFRFKNLPHKTFLSTENGALIKTANPGIVKPFGGTASVIARFWHILYSYQLLVHFTLV